MRKLLASLFVISALLGVGVFATAAYFQVQQAGPGFTLTTGTADLDVAQVDGTLTGSPLMVGPGFDEYTCIRIHNTGDYALDVTLTLSTPPADRLALAVQNALDLSINPTPDCTGYGTDYLLSAYLVPNNPQSLGPTLAVGATSYAVLRLHWNAAADQLNQNNLQGYTGFTITGTITGTTPH